MWRSSPPPKSKPLGVDEENALPPLTGRFLVLSGLAYALIFLGLITLNGNPLALAIPLLLYVGSTLLHRPPEVNLHAQRTLSADIVPPGTPVTVTLRVTNQGPDLDEVLIEDALPEGLELVDGKLGLLTGMPSGASVEIRYVVRAARGSFPFQDAVASVSEHLGVMRHRVLLPGRMRLLFLPEVVRLHHVAIRPRRTHGHFGPIPSRKPGSGVDFYGLREYQMGDPQRWINWRASARHNQEIFVNQFEQERIADVGIIVDARAQSNLKLASGESLFEYSVRAAGSISEALLNDGNRVGLLIYGFGMERVFPGYGKVQQERILYTLGRAHTGHNFALESLGVLPTRFFPAGSQIVMVSPLVVTDVPAYMQLRASGYELMLISPDPVDFEARGFGGKDGLSWRIARVERALALRKLQRMGIRILDWQVNKPLEPLVRTTLSHALPGRTTGGVIR